MAWFKSSRYLSLWFLLLIIVLAPLFFPSGFYYRVGTLIFINALAVLGLVILMGYAGQVSLGHAGFFGIGAYACAFGPTYLGIPPLFSLLLGAAVSALIAWVVGRPILRLKGHYLAIASLGFGLLIFMVLINEAQLTGGPDGMPVESLGLAKFLKGMGFQLKTTEVWYGLSAFILLIGVWLALNLYHSRTGRALRALHDSSVAAQSMGVDVARYKLIAFTVSAVYASVAGSLLALFNRFTNPDTASFLHSVEMVTMAVLGGAGSVLGGVLGAFILTVLQQALTFFHEYEHIMLGLIMMLLMIFMPAGLVPSLARYLGKRSE